MQNHYSLWKYLLMIGLLLIAILYAIPNIYGDDPAVQVSAHSGSIVNQTVINQVNTALQNSQLHDLSAAIEDDNLVVRFADTETQLHASDVIKATLGKDFIVALNLAPRTPHWLRAIGANPMKLGLDLRGGVHFLFDVDVASVIKARQEGDLRSFTDQLREEDIRYSNVSMQEPNTIALQFRDDDTLKRGQSYLSKRFPEYTFTANGLSLNATLTQAAIQKIDEYAVDQTITIFNNRVNELGVSEAVVQQQGTDQVSVDLPGIQDTARAKDLIGKTATLKFQMVDTSHDVQSAVAGEVPFGDRLFQYEGSPILLKDQAILRGDSITYATSGMGDDGRPDVQVRLGGGGESLFEQTTAQSVGKSMAVVYVETQVQTKMVNGKPVTTQQQIEKIISVATIQSALGNNFEIRGLDSPKYAQDLALLLRSGALSAPVSIVQERTVGPSLGKANIHMGVRSVEVGALLVIIFMALYYRLFGFVADTALAFNIIFIIAVLSILGATLTLPGIAGIVLTVGLAVDANVLINERIREELRNGMSPQASIHTGYARAFATIIDANVTTLIVAMVLFALGSGAVKGFAVTLTIGIISSMVTAIFFTRGIVNLIYGGRTVKKLSIGI
jgi:preprotein translocase subunit SecD